MPLTLTATANQALWPVKEFQVKVGSEPVRTVTATDNSASFQVTPVEGDYIWVSVRSVSLDGTVSSEGSAVVSASEFYPSARSARVCR